MKTSIGNALAFTFGPLTRRRNKFHIIMYHLLGNEPGSNFHQSLTVFRTQMKRLKELDYKTYRIDQLNSVLSSESKEKAVFITFDDGWACQFNLAVPVLCDLSFTATFFIPTAYIGDTRQKPPAGSSLSKYKNEKFCSWNDMISLDRMGFEIGSHSHSHAIMTEISEAQKRNELGKSKSVLEDCLGHSIAGFAYPYGTKKTHSDACRKLLRESGYEYACTTQWGGIDKKTDHLTLPRIAIYPCDSDKVFYRKVSGNYDNLEWLRG